MIQQVSDGQGPGGDVAANIDRELGAITQRLTGIEKRLDEGDRDMQGLMKSTTDLTIAVAGLTSRISSLAESQIAARTHEDKIVAALEKMVDRLAAPAQATMGPGTVAAVAVPSAGGGGVIGAALWAKLASLLGLS